jgi:hypothetical protein
MSSKTKSSSTPEKSAKPAKPRAKRKRRELTIAQKLAIIESWKHGDPQEQKETFECLKKALGPDRPSYRKLF